MASKIKGYEQIQDGTIVPSLINLNQLFQFKGLGVKDPALYLNYGYTGAGVPGNYAYLWVDRGTLTDVALRWNELTSTWQYTNDGAIWSDIGAGGGIQWPDEHSVTVGNQGDYATITLASAAISGGGLPPGPAAENNRYSIVVYEPEITEDFTVPSWTRVVFAGLSVIRGAGVAGAGPVITVEPNGAIDLTNAFPIIDNRVARKAAGDRFIEAHTDSTALAVGATFLTGGTQIVFGPTTWYGNDMHIDLVFDLDGTNNNRGAFILQGLDSIPRNINATNIYVSDDGGGGAVQAGGIYLSGSDPAYNLVEVDLPLSDTGVHPLGAFFMLLKNTLIDTLSLDGSAVGTPVARVYLDNADIETYSYDNAAGWTVRTDTITGSFINAVDDDLVTNFVPGDDTFVLQSSTTLWSVVSPLQSTLWMVDDCYWLCANVDAALRFTFDINRLMRATRFRSAALQDLTAVTTEGGMIVAPLYQTNRTLYSAAPAAYVSQLRQHSMASENVLPLSFLTSGQMQDSADLPGLYVRRSGHNMWGESWELYEGGDSVNSLYYDVLTDAPYLAIASGTVSPSPATARYTPSGNAVQLAPQEGFKRGMPSLNEFIAANNFAGFCIGVLLYVPANMWLGAGGWPDRAFRVALFDDSGRWREFAVGNNGPGLYLSYQDPNGAIPFWSHVIAGAPADEWYRFFFFFTPNDHAAISGVTNEQFAVITDAGSPAAINDPTSVTYHSGIQNSVAPPKMNSFGRQLPGFGMFAAPGNPDVLNIAEWGVFPGCRLYPRFYGLNRPPSPRS